MPHTLHLGPIALEWRFDAADPRWRPFQEGYSGYLDDARGQLVIEAEVGAPVASPAGTLLPNSLIRAHRVSGRDFDLGDGLVRGTLAGTDRCRCEIDPALLAGHGLRVLEQFIYLLFYQAAHGGAERRAEAPFLLHSSAALGQAGAHVFCGPAGAGKSTAIAAAGGRSVLTDETAVIVPRPDVPLVEGSPVNPFFTAKVPGSAPLAGVYLIEQAKAHALLPIACRDAVPRLTAEVMVPLGLLEPDLARGMARALDCALLLCDSGRVRRLCLLPDPDFWALLEPKPATKGKRG